MAVIGARPGDRHRRPRSPLAAAAGPRSRGPRVRHVGALRQRRQASVAGLLATIAAAAGLALFYLSQSTPRSRGRLPDRQAAVPDRDPEGRAAAASCSRSERAPRPVGGPEQGRPDLKLVPLPQSAVTFAIPSSGAAAPAHRQTPPTQPGATRRSTETPCSPGPIAVLAPSSCWSCGPDRDRDRRAAGLVARRPARPA